MDPLGPPRRFLCRHKEAYHKAHHSAHLGYFALIFLHGPYHWAAAACFIFGLISWLILHDLGE